MHKNMRVGCPERIPQSGQVLASPQVPFIAKAMAVAKKRAYEKRIHAVLYNVKRKIFWVAGNNVFRLEGF